LTFRIRMSSSLMAPPSPSLTCCNCASASRGSLVVFFSVSSSLMRNILWMLSLSCCRVSWEDSGSGLESVACSAPFGRPHATALQESPDSLVLLLELLLALLLKTCRFAPYRSVLSTPSQNAPSTFLLSQLVDVGRRRSSR